MSKEQYPFQKLETVLKNATDELDKLMQHIFTPTDECPDTCKICGKNFRSKHHCRTT